MHKFHWEPSLFLNMTDEEQAFIIAAVDLRVEAEKKETKKIKK